MEKTIIHRGKELYYTLRGEGKAVMLLHGFAEDNTIWDELATSLENTYQFITPDLPGSGRSELLPVLSIDSLAEGAKAILDAEKISEAVVIGHSMGGYVSLAFAELYPSMVAALGLFHSSAFADDEEKIGSRKKNIAFIQSHGTLAFLKQATPTLFSDVTKRENPGLVEVLISKYGAFDPKALQAYQEAMMGRPERLSVLKNIVKPLLMIIGREDKAIPYDLSIRQSHLPSCAYIHILEKSGHMGMQEELNKCQRILKDFLACLS